MTPAKTSHLNIRVAPADDALLRQAAGLLGESALRVRDRERAAYGPTA